MTTTDRRDTIDLKALHLKQEQELLSELAGNLLHAPDTADVAIVRRPTTTRVILTWEQDRHPLLAGDLRRARQIPNDVLDMNPTMRTFALTEAVALSCRDLLERELDGNPR